jgi:hypothetical protein
LKTVSLSTSVERKRGELLYGVMPRRRSSSGCFHIAFTHDFSEQPRRLKKEVLVRAFWGVIQKPDDYPRINGPIKRTTYLRHGSVPLSTIAPMI